MTRILILLFLTAWVLCSCGSESLADDTPTYTANILVVPDKYAGDVANYFSPVHQIHVEKKQSVKFFASIAIDDARYTGDTLYNFIESILWNIDGTYFNLPSFRYTFASTGQKSGYLIFTDFWGDTSRVDLDIFVNTPNKITLLYPYDGYNQASPADDQETPLRWNLEGLDPWESASCSIYISDNEDDLWDNNIGTTDCNNEVTLKGSLIGKMYAAAKDSSFTLYWAVAAEITSESGLTEYDSSEVFRFSTKILNEAYSGLTIPILYKDYSGSNPLRTEITLVNAAGDTLQTLTSEKSKAVVSTQVPPQSGLKVFVRELLSREYEPESTLVDIPESTVVQLDTFALVDRTSPQAAPFATPINPNDPVQFTVYDDGSGINTNKLKVLFMNDTIESEYSAPNLTFENMCWGKCKLQIVGEDNAKNSLPDTYWLMERSGDSLYINGPYITGGN